MRCPGLLLHLFHATPSLAATFEVGTDPAYPTVGSAVAVAADGDVIRIHAAGGPYAEAVQIDGLTVDLVGVDQPLLQPVGASGFFDVSGDSVVLVEGITLDGQSAYRAGTIRAFASLTLVDATVQQTTEAIEDGGSFIVQDSARLTVVDTRFEASSAPKGGFLKVSGDAVLQVQRSTFVAGSANDGGAIRCDGTCTVVDSVFVANAADKGAAINVKMGAETTLARNRFCDNVADGEGGALWLEGSSGLDHNVFMGNLAHEGGAIWASDDQAWEHNDYLGNVASKGAAVHLRFGRVTASHELFLDNDGSEEILSDDEGASFALSYSLFQDNEGELAHGDDTVFGDPKLTDLDYADCEGSVLTLEPGSAAIDAGDPEQPDPDGSPADIGAFTAGPCEPTAEVPGDGVDSDCDGTELCLADDDGDGRGEPGTVQTSSDLDCTDPGEAVTDDDRCVGFDDRVDSDSDGVPDGCDETTTEPDPDPPDGPVIHEGDVPPHWFCNQAGGSGSTPWLAGTMLWLATRRRRADRATK